MEITAYAYFDKEYLRGLGEKAGLTGDDLDYFVYFEEVELVLDVNEKTGEVSGVKAIFK